MRIVFLTGWPKAVSCGCRFCCCVLVFGRLGWRLFGGERNTFLWVSVGCGLALGYIVFVVLSWLLFILGFALSVLAWPWGAPLCTTLPRLTCPDLTSACVSLMLSVSTGRPRALLPSVWFICFVFRFGRDLQAEGGDSLLPEPLSRPAISRSRDRSPPEGDPSHSLRHLTSARRKFSTSFFCRRPPL